MATGRIDRNGEGYADPTAGTALGNIRREGRREERNKDAAVMETISRLIPIMKQTAELAGFEVIGRIALKDKTTGKEWR